MIRDIVMAAAGWAAALIAVTALMVICVVAAIAVLAVAGSPGWHLP